MIKNFSNRVGNALILAAVLYASIAFALFPRWTVDDAYIIFRYAENFSSHGELTWNVGVDPVEGYTGVLLPVLLSAGDSLGIPPFILSDIIGIASFFVGFLFLFLLFRKFRISRLVTGGILLLYATLPISITHATSGLETMLFIGSIMASLFFFARFLLTPVVSWKQLTALPLSLLIVSLARPEGVALAGIFFLGGGLFCYRYHRDRLAAYGAIFLAAYIIPAAAYFFWRFQYYGGVLPNTLYAKEGTGFSLSYLIDAARFLRRFFAVPFLAGVLLLMPELDSIRTMIREKTQEEKRAYVFFFGCSALFVSAIVWEIATKHLLMNFSQRFYTPLVPFVLIVLGILCGSGLSLLQETKNDRPLRYRAALALFCLLIAYQALFHIAKLDDEKRYAMDQEKIQQTQHNPIGRFLKEHIPASEWLIVYIDAGAIPYFSGLKTIDFGALNDETLAQKKLTPEERIDYFFSFHPGAVVFTSEREDRVAYGEEAEAIVQDPRFGEYVLVKTYLSQLDPPLPYHEFLFVRRDIAKTLP